MTHERQTKGLAVNKHTSLPALLAALCLTALLGFTACTPGAQTVNDVPEQEQEQQEQPAETTDDEETVDEIDVVVGAEGEGESGANTETDETGETPAVESQRDPADPPIAMIEYASQTISPLTCSSTWTFEQDGEQMTVTTDAPHPVQYAADGMPSVTAAEPAGITVNFDVAATDAEVTRYLESDITAAAEAAGSVHDISASDVIGEVIDANVEGGSVSFGVEPGYRYALEVFFEQGVATYVFTVH